MNETPHPDSAGHTHRLPRWLVGGVALSLVGLMLAVALVSVQTITTNHRLSALEQYVEGRGVFRDAEAQRQDRRFRTFVCDVLDQLPGDTSLDRVRAQYGCGPGLPAGQP